MVEYHFAAVLAEDDQQRQAGLQPWTLKDRKTLERFDVDARSEHDLAIVEILDAADPFAKMRLDEEDTGLDFKELINDLVALSLGETRDVFTLGFHAKTGFALT